MRRRAHPRHRAWPATATHRSAIGTCPQGPAPARGRAALGVPCAGGRYPIHAACATADIIHGHICHACNFSAAHVVAVLTCWQVPGIKRGGQAEPSHVLHASIRACKLTDNDQSWQSGVIGRPADPHAVRPPGWAAGQGRAPAQRSRSRTTAGTAPRRRSRAPPRAGRPCPSARARCRAAPASSCKMPACAVAAHVA